ncbi:MAG: DUF4422 domain-containing protein [Quinella sp. 3Q1]|nr:DUF4422 domain-containing protein [Quinella sp. 3Q1]
MAIYVPRVLVCGSVEDFRKKIGNKPAQVVGQIIFKMTGSDVKLFFSERSLTADDIKNLLDGAAEYLIFNDALDFYYYCRKFPLNRQAMTAETFAKKIHGGFFTTEILILLESLLEAKNFSCVLDFDAFFAESDFRTPTKNFHVAVDCLAEKIYPIMEHVYGKIYRTFDECKFHHFDALILAKERTPAEFIDVLIKTDALTENIWAFVRKNSALEKFLAANENIFAKVEYFKAVNGGWFQIKKIAPPADVGVYVVTHKDAKLAALPAGYKFIHAGHTLAKKDFGYTGDDSGDNISALNPFLDEVTALYWIWKNTRHTHAGLVHYRRFFTGDANQKTFDAEKILSAAAILKILREYDIIVKSEGFTDYSQRDMMLLSTGQPNLINIAEKIIRGHLSRTQPDYLDAFDDVLSGITLFPCGMFIARRNIFDAYCEWLFSFMLGATEEVRDKIQIGDKNLAEMGHDYSRITGFFAERMLTVWLMKNHLRIKELPTMFREGV